eukprot:6214499-Pleurochrysis_carterae.AAC.2
MNYNQCSELDYSLHVARNACTNDAALEARMYSPPYAALRTRLIPSPVGRARPARPASQTRWFVRARDSVC